MNTTTTYSPTTGLVTTVTQTGTSTAVATGYDAWGRAITYTPSGQAQTTTGYDILGRVATITGPHGATTFGYGLDSQGRVENRGMPTSVVHSRDGRTVSFSGAYDAAGVLIEQVMPGGITQTWTYDSAGEPVGESFTGPDGPDPGTDPDPWLAWTQTNDVLGRVTTMTTPNLSAFAGQSTTPVSHLAYRYNGRGQLLSVVDRRSDPTTGADTGCSTRRYEFTLNGARSAQITSTAPAGAKCTAPTATTTRTWKVSLKSPCLVP